MNKKIKLLVVADMLFPYTGITKFLFEVLPRLKNFDITVAYPEKERKLKIKEVKEAVFPYNFKIFELPIVDVSKRIKLRRLVEKSDIVWIQFISPLSIMAINYSKRYNKKILAFLHIFEDEIFHAKALLPFKILKLGVKAVAKRYYNKCDIIIVPAENVGLKVKNIGIKPKQKIVPLGVNLGKIIEKKRARKILGIKENSFVITSIGRLSKEKDIDTLVEAYKNFKKERKNTTLLLVGWGSKSEINKLRKIKDVRITGYVPNTLPYLSASDVFVLTSVTETTSLATLEAMAVGLPVIVTKVGYVSGYVKNMYNGLFFEMKNVDDLGKKLIALYKNKELRKKLGKNAKKTVRNFSWSRTANSLSKVFTSLINKRHK